MLHALVILLSMMTKAFISIHCSVLRTRPNFHQECFTRIGTIFSRLPCSKERLGARPPNSGSRKTPPNYQGFSFSICSIRHSAGKKLVYEIPSSSPVTKPPGAQAVRSTFADRCRWDFVVQPFLVLAPFDFINIVLRYLIR